MKNLAIKSLTLMLVLNLCHTAYAQNNTKAKAKQSIKDTTEIQKKYKVTFIELGSVRCIPCQKMQVVIKSVEEKYGDQVKTVFYDVWTEEGKPYATLYNINMIPVQVFLDENGKEFYRHVGFFPEDELVKVLKSKGVTD